MGRNAPGSSSNTPPDNGNPQQTVEQNKQTTKVINTTGIDNPQDQQTAKQPTAPPPQALKQGGPPAGQLISTQGTKQVNDQTNVQTNDQTNVQTQTNDQTNDQTNAQTNVQTQTNVQANIQTDSAAWLANKSKENVENTVQGVVSEFNVGKHVSAKSKWRREKAFTGKKRLHDAQVSQNWRAEKENQVWRQGTLPAAKPLQTVSADILAMYNCEKTFMKYTDDEAFINNFAASSAELEKYAALKQSLEGKQQADLDALNIAGLKDVKIEDLKKMAEKYSGILNFYRAKMDIISNPFYMVLRKTDTKLLKLETLRAKESECRADGRNDLADYLNAIIRLREAEALGYSRGTENSAIVSYQAGSGLKNKNTEASLTIGAKEKSVDIVVGLKAEHSVEGTKADKKKEFGSLSGQEESSADEIEKSNEIVAGLEVSGTVQAQGINAQAKAHKGDEDANAGAHAEFVVGEVKASGSVGASLGYNFDEGVIVDIGVSAEASAALAKGKTGVHLSFLGGLFGVHAEVEATAVEAKAGVTAKAGNFTMNGVEHFGVGAMAQAEVSAATATGKIGVTILGFKFTFSGQGQAGAGATAGGYISSKGIGASLGATLGFGGKLGLDIDISHWTDKLKDKIVEEVKESRMK